MIGCWSTDATFQAAAFTVDQEAATIDAYVQWLTHQAPGTVSTWNGSNFDLPFIVDRAAMHGIDTGILLTPSAQRPAKYQPLPGHTSGYEASFAVDGRTRHTHIDIAYPYKSWAANRDVAWSLKPVADALDLDPVVEARGSLSDIPVDRLLAYNLSDCRITHAAAAKLDDLDTHVDQR